MRILLATDPGLPSMGCRPLNHEAEPSEQRMASKKKANQLNPRQRLFVKEYLVDLNARQAAVRAGYNKNGAHTHGSRLLNNAIIAKEIEEGLQKRLKRIDVTADRVIEELARIGFSDVRDVLTWSSNQANLIDSSAMEDEAASAIESISIKDTEYGMDYRIKMHSKITALRALGEHLGIFDHEFNGHDDEDEDDRVVSQYAKDLEESLA